MTVSNSELINHPEVGAIGFHCVHCEHKNMFTGEDADYLMATGKDSFEGKTLQCKHCGKDNFMGD